MNIERKLFSTIFLRPDGVPRNFEAPVAEELDDSAIVKQFTEMDIAELHAEARAFKLSQRKFALGVVALVGSTVNVLNPPQDIGEFAINFLPAAFVQTVSYLSFKNGVHLMRGRQGTDSDNA